MRVVSLVKRGEPAVVFRSKQLSREALIRFLGVVGAVIRGLAAEGPDSEPLLTLVLECADALTRMAKMRNRDDDAPVRMGVVGLSMQIVEDREGRERECRAAAAAFLAACAVGHTLRLHLPPNKYEYADALVACMFRVATVETDALVLQGTMTFMVSFTLALGDDRARSAVARIPGLVEALVRVCSGISATAIEPTFDNLLCTGIRSIMHLAHCGQARRVFSTPSLVDMLVRTALSDAASDQARMLSLYALSNFVLQPGMPFLVWSTPGVIDAAAKFVNTIGKERIAGDVKDRDLAWLQLEDAFWKPGIILLKNLSREPRLRQTLRDNAAVVQAAKRALEECEDNETMDKAWELAENLGLKVDPRDKGEDAALRGALEGMSRAELITLAQSLGFRVARGGGGGGVGVGERRGAVVGGGDLSGERLWSVSGLGRWMRWCVGR